MLICSAEKFFEISLNKQLVSFIFGHRYLQIIHLVIGVHESLLARRLELILLH